MIMEYPFYNSGLWGSGHLSKFLNAILSFGSSTEHLRFLTLKPILMNLMNVRKVVTVMKKVLLLWTSYKMILYLQVH